MECSWVYFVILQVAQGQITKAAGRLGPETDVWALALSLLYCLCGYHVMVYVNTGEIMYRNLNPKELQAKRIQCVFQVGTRVCFSCQRCFTSTETTRLIRDGEPRMATSSFRRLLSLHFPHTIHCTFVGHLCIALFSAFQQTHCALFAPDS